MLSRLISSVGKSVGLTIQRLLVRASPRELMKTDFQSTPILEGLTTKSKANTGWLGQYKHVEWVAMHPSLRGKIPLRSVYRE